MAIQPLTPMPSPPLPTDSEDVFDEHAGTSLTAQVTFTNEMNEEVIPGINAAVQQVHEDALYAGQAADRAEAVDTTLGHYVEDAAAEVTKAAAEVSKAKVQAENAAASALAAESASGSIGNLALLHAVALSF
ncbi:MAG: hypothetical protein ACRER8_12305 [Pseudomonas sp.]|uniref:hypothetical protein n=1 Tax=Pseudomonas sp. TaxID=306 RepID=UPI003D6DD813